MPPSEDRNRPLAIAADNSGDVAPPWSSLPMDLIGLLGWRVLAGDMLDYVRFRAVCTDWRSGTVCPRGRGIIDSRFHPRRWMILPEGHGLHPADGKKRFFNLSTGSFVRIWLPLLSDHGVLVTVEGLLLLWLYRHQDAAIMLLLHPFTGDIMKLPPLMPLLKSYWLVLGEYCWAPLNFVASLSVNADGIAAVVIVHQYIPHVFFATTKDKQWSVSTWNLTPLSSPISFQGKLYILEPHVAFSSTQLIMQLDPPCHDHATKSSSLIPPKLIATCPKGEDHVLFGLADCDSEILVIGYENNPFTDKLLVYKVTDLSKGKVTPMPSLGGNTIFLDIGRSTNIETGDIIISRCMTSSYRAMPTIVSNTIVRLDQQYPRQYDLGTGKWSQIMGGCVNDSYNMEDACNCGLIYHLYNCCHCTHEYSFFSVENFYF